MTDTLLQTEINQILAEQERYMDSITKDLANGYLSITNPTNDQTTIFNNNLQSNLASLAAFSSAEAKLEKSQIVQNLLDVVQHATLSDIVTQNSLDIVNLQTGAFAVSQIPTLTVAKIPSLDASNLQTANFAVSQIPVLSSYQSSGNYFSVSSLDASNLQTGTFVLSQIPALTVDKIPALDASNLQTGTFALSQIPFLSAYQPSGNYLTSIAALDASNCRTGTFLASQTPATQKGTLGSFYSCDGNGSGGSTKTLVATGSTTLAGKLQAYQNCANFAKSALNLSITSDPGTGGAIYVSILGGAKWFSITSDSAQACYGFVHPGNILDACYGRLIIKS